MKLRNSNNFKLYKLKEQIEIFYSINLWHESENFWTYDSVGQPANLEQIQWQADLLSPAILIITDEAKWGYSYNSKY